MGSGADNRLKVLFFLRGIHYGRVFENFLRALLERGHLVHVDLALEKRSLGEDKSKLFDAFRKDFAGFSYQQLPRRSELWLRPAVAMRHALDYLRYLEPEFGHASPLRARARSRAPWLVRALVVFPCRGSFGRQALRRALRYIEAAVPIPQEISDEIERRAPDVVLVSPLVGLGSIESDYVRAATAAGIPTVLPVASWDNLSNKGLIRDVPTLTIVWNQAQVDEAVRLHGVPANQVRAVGAHSFDHWFAWRPSRTREELLRQLGLESDRPLVLYLGSSYFISGDETTFVRDWLTHLRGDPRFTDVGVILRPHPQNSVGWMELDPDDPGRTVVWPRIGEAPTDRARKADYFDCLYHASAVVGINTSAQVEASIVGRPVLTLISEYFPTQEGTLHFSHIAHSEEGGVVTVARDWGQHLDQIAEAIADPTAYRDRIDTFLDCFIGPGDVRGAAAKVAAMAVEEAAAARVERTQRTPPLRPFLVLLTPVLPLFFALRHPRRTFHVLLKVGRRYRKRFRRYVNQQARRLKAPRRTAARARARRAAAAANRRSLRAQSRSKTARKARGRNGQHEAADGARDELHRAEAQSRHP